MILPAKSIRGSGLRVCVVCCVVCLCACCVARCDGLMLWCLRCCFKCRNGFLGVCVVLDAVRVAHVVSIYLQVRRARGVAMTAWPISDGGQRQEAVVPIPPLSPP